MSARSLVDIEQNMDFVGCDNDTALALCRALRIAVAALREIASGNTDCADPMYNACDQNAGLALSKVESLVDVEP